MGAKTHKSLVQYFLHDVLSHYSCILLSNSYMTGFIGVDVCCLPYLIWLTQLGINIEFCN